MNRFISIDMTTQIYMNRLTWVNRYEQTEIGRYDQIEVDREI